MADISAAIFDVDGVLLDSLDAHLQICRDEARKIPLDIRIPSAGEFRDLVARGAVISPMEEFFVTVGFTRKQAKIANEHYRNEFAKKYPVRPFAGVQEMLQIVAATGLELGVVTSNTRAIISSALGEAIKFFNPHAIFADDDAQRVTKSQALIDSARNCGIEPDATIYIGDQPRDFAAAQAAHVQFLGVTYGWGITPDDTRFPLAHTPQEIAAYIRAHARAQK